MTTIPEGLEAATLHPADDAIATYLLKHPDFFERHISLLATLRLPHVRGAATVSLIERQVDVLRDKSQGLEARLTELVQVARTNETLVEKIHQLTRRLLAADNRPAVIAQLGASLREEFALPDSHLLLFGLGALELPVDRFATVIDSREPGLASFDTLFTAGKPRCGPLRDAQREFLFGGDSAHIQSAALVPLGGRQAFGLLALGSPDAERFNPTMSTEFLARWGELAGDALARG